MIRIPRCVDADSVNGLLVCVTVDFEPDCPPYLWTWRGIVEGAPRLQHLLEDEGVRATYFVTGETARRYPDTVRDLVISGHELGSHGVTHRSFKSLDREEADREISKSANILRVFSPVTAFRAPYLEFPDQYLGLLEKAGFLTDCSLAKYKPSYMLGRPDTNILRLATSITSSALRLPTWLRDPWLAMLRTPVILFVHPWEFVDLTSSSLRLDCRFRTGKTAIADLRSTIRLFKSWGARFLTVGELAVGMREQMRAGQIGRHG